MPATLPVDDLPPAPGGRRVPPGLVVALVLATVVLALAVAAAVRSGSPEPEPAAGGAGFATPGKLGVGGRDLEGQPLPDLAFTRFDGTPASLGDYRGRPLVLNFWASTCAPCLQEMPAFDEVHGQLGDQVGFVGMDVADSEENGNAMAERTGVQFDLGRDPTGELFTSLGGVVLPTTVVARADGTVSTVHTGVWTADELRAAIAGAGGPG